MEICLDDIISVEEIQLDYVYDLTVENTHWYFLDCGKPILVHNSGKTISILQVLFLTAVYSKKPLIISVVSRALPHLKLGAMRDLDNIIQSWGMSLSCKNRTDSIYHIGNSLIEFFGADQLDKVHGPGRDILFLNEANFIKYDVFDQLYNRTTGTTFIDFNPTRKFWAHDFIGQKDVVFMKSTYIDNELIPASLVEKIEAKKGNKAWWRVYGEGEIGIAEGAIFTNWAYGKFPVDIPFGFGLDYGFHPDPDALVKVAVDEKFKKIYAKECIYETLQGTDVLLENMKQFCSPMDLIIAESATPRTNYDLKKYFKGLEAVSKTKTVAEWLRKMQDYEILITEDSYNLEIELSNYVWSDKRSGIPMAGFEHCVDGMRYYYMRMSKKLRRNL
jgi:phage terminase large subunit